MPIYEYRCDCGCEREELLAIQNRNEPQICECGETMQRKMSVSNFVMKQTGNQMALDSLNSKTGGFPDGDLRPGAQQITAAGLERPPKTIW